MSRPLTKEISLSEGEHSCRDREREAKELQRISTYDLYDGLVGAIFIGRKTRLRNLNESQSPSERGTPMHLFDLRWLVSFLRRPPVQYDSLTLATRLESAEIA